MFESLSGITSFQSDFNFSATQLDTALCHGTPFGNHRFQCLSVRLSVRLCVVDSADLLHLRSLCLLQHAQLEFPQLNKRAIVNRKHRQSLMSRLNYSVS